MYFFLKSFKNWIFVWLSQSTSALQHWLHKCQYGILSVQCIAVQLRTVCPLITATCPPTSCFTVEIFWRKQTIYNSDKVLIFNFSWIFKYNLYRKFLTPNTPGFLFMWIVQLLPYNTLNKMDWFCVFSNYLVKNILLSDTKYVWSQKKNAQSSYPLKIEMSLCLN